MIRVSLELDKKQLRSVERDLKKLETGMPKILSRAANKAVTSARVSLVRELQGRYIPIEVTQVSSPGTIPDIPMEATQISRDVIPDIPVDVTPDISIDDRRGPLWRNVCQDAPVSCRLSCKPYASRVNGR